MNDDFELVFEDIISLFFGAFTVIVVILCYDLNYFLGIGVTCEQQFE